MNEYELEKRRKEVRNLTFDALVDVRKVLDLKVLGIIDHHKTSVIYTIFIGSILSCWLVFMLVNYDPEATALAGVCSSVFITGLATVLFYSYDPIEKRDIEELSSEMDLLIERMGADSKRPISDLQINFENIEARLTHLGVKIPKIWKRARKLERDIDALALSK